MLELEKLNVSPEQTLNLPDPTKFPTNFRKFLVDFKFLFLEQILQLRVALPFVITFALVMPFSLIFGFARLGSGLHDYNSLIYIVSGAAISSVAMEGIANMSGRIANLKNDGRLLYYASLPISKVAFVLAFLLSRLLTVSLLGLVTPLLLGSLFYNLELKASLFLGLVLLPLCAAAISGFGLMLGVWAKSPELATMVANLLIFVIILASPVFIVLSALPLPVQWFSFLLPTTYAADALRRSLVGLIDPTFYFDVSMLVLMLGLMFLAINKLLRWRLD